jgi:hypothetical protein
VFTVHVAGHPKGRGRETTAEDITLWFLMHDPNHSRRREAGGISTALGAFVIALLIGGGIGVAVRRSQPTKIPDVPFGTAITTLAIADSSIPSLSTLGLETTLVSDTTEPVTTEATTTLPPETDPPTTEAPVTTEPPLSADLSLATSGAILNSPGNAERRLVDASLGCDGFSISKEPGASVACGDLDFDGKAAKWVVSSAGLVDVLVSSQGADGTTEWNLALTGPDAGRSADPQAIDLTGDGSPELLVGFSDGGTLRIDVAKIDGSGGRPSMHVDLPKGRARVIAGVLNVWFSGGVRGKLTRATIQQEGDTWTIRPVESVLIENAEPSQL